MRFARRTCFAALLLASAGCGPSGPFSLATCAFGVGATACSPVLVAGGPKSSWDIRFDVRNPNPGAPAGCAGNVDLAVNSQRSGGGRALWDAIEQDQSPQCNPVGEPIQGTVTLETARNIDIRFPRGQFTFRILVRPESQPAQ